MRNLSPYSWRKEIPEELITPVLKALKFYPELQTKSIEFKYTRRARTSIMKAQPKIRSMLRIGEDRSYVVYVNREIKLGGERMRIQDLPENVLVGWFGHELGHIVDYERQSNWGMLWFGLGYVFSGRFIKGAEKRADEIAVYHGLGEQILATKKFILSHAGISKRYKRKIKKYYPSPEQIMEIIKGEKTLEKIVS